ncbi:MAG: hypothetical protein Q8K60_08950, partial [Parachlamydiaceae bacterium]|nr:hypothetical protein [Parachlamydiaceae bacterium]
MLVFLPNLLKNPAGKNFAIQSINLFIPGKIDFEELNLQWNGPQKIKGIILKTPDQQEALRIKEVDTDFSLFDLLFGQDIPKKLKINQSKFSPIDKDKSSNLEQAIGYNFTNKTRHSIQKVISLFGDQIDASYFGKIKLDQGPIQIMIKGSNGFVKIDGKISENKFTLNLPLEAQFNITPEISNLFFSKNIPLLKYAIASERPVTLKILPENFSFPIRHFDLNQLTFKEASIDFGKLKFENHDEFKTYLNYISNQLDQIDIWFTPIYFKLNQSLLSIHRFDFL